MLNWSQALPKWFVLIQRPYTWVTVCTGHTGDTSSPREEVMPWKECSVMDERLQFVARRLAGEEGLIFEICMCCFYNTSNTINLVSATKYTPLGSLNTASS